MCSPIAHNTHDGFALLPAGLSAIAIALGESHACAIGSGGGIKCWGWNGDGQLGIGSTADQHSPMDVPGAE